MQRVGSVQPSPFRRHKWLNRALDTSWKRGWSCYPALDTDALIDKVANAHRSDDFGGNTAWTRNLEMLVQALNNEARLNPLRRTIAYGQLTSALSNRLRMTRLWRDHPEIAAHPVTAPVIIVGQMRSGTTRMQRLLACDDRLRYTRFYESWNPLPATHGSVDDRIVRGAIGLTAARLINPRFPLIHPTSLRAPDEEIGLQSLSFFGAAFEAQWRVPGFARHCETTDTTAVYREFRALIQTLGWLRGDTGDRPYVLKVPQFSQDLTTVLKIFPDARLIHLSRDPQALVSSAASLAHNQMQVQSDHVEPAWIGREWLHKVALRHRRTRSALQNYSGASVEVPFAVMNDDWQAELDKVYAMLGMPLGPDLRAKMATSLSRATRHKLHRHHHSLDRFGLSAGDVTAALHVDDRTWRTDERTAVAA